MVLKVQVGAVAANHLPNWLNLAQVEGLLRKPDWPGAFSHLLATTVAAKRDDYWFMVGLMSK